MLTPHEMANKRIELAEEYSRYSGEWVKCNKALADFFNDNRDKHNSDNACQKAFDRTEQGVLMVTLKMKLKAIEKEMSALNTALRLAENEAHNLY